jgi:beta-lactamase regulating signal transducer with metallopeptidase domain
MREILQLLFDMTFSTSVFILAILGIRFLFKNSSKNSRLLLWLLVGIKLLLPFNLESNFSLIPETLFEKSTDDISETISKVVVPSSDVKGELMNYESVFLLIWALGITIILIYGAVSFWRLHKNISDAVKKDGNLFQSEKVVSPFVLGIIKPKIYTPFNLDDETLSHIVSHEKSHIRNLDHITKLLAFVLLAVHWFNPLVWISFMLFTKDIELACDERVVKNYSLERRKSYAEALLNCAVNEGRGLIYPVAFGEVSVKDRIKSVVAYKKTMKTVLALFFGVVIVATVCLGTVPKVSAKEPAQNEIPVVEETTTEVYVEELTTEAYVEETTTEPVTEVAIEPETTEEYVYYETQPVFNLDDIDPEYREIFSIAQEEGKHVGEVMLQQQIEAGVYNLNDEYDNYPTREPETYPSVITPPEVIELIPDGNYEKAPGMPGLGSSGQGW